MRKLLLCSVAGCAFTVVPTFAATVSNPTAGCSGNTAAYDPGTGQKHRRPAGIHRFGVRERSELSDRHRLPPDQEWKRRRQRRRR